MYKNNLIYLILAILCSFPVLAQTDPNNWDKLNLNLTTIAGTKVYYEKSFESKLPFFEKKYKELLAKQNEKKIFESKKDQILADINNILGIKEPPNENQEKFFSGFLSLMSSFENTTFYLVKQNDIKDFLRAGGQLPDFTYNKETDTAVYKPYFHSTKDNPQNNFPEFAIPIDSVENFESSLDTFLNLLHKNLGQLMEGSVIHEITEMTLLIYVKQTDPYWRWFTDGFSEVITYELLKKHFDISRAEEYASHNNVEQFSEYKNEINLRYWMSGQFCILTSGLPTKKGDDFTIARYAYATYEARRFVDKYGIGYVSKILDDVTKKDSRTGNDLIESIKNVTGEDMNVRLDAYQSFKDKQEAIEKYANAFNEAVDNKNTEEMLFNMFRMHDFRDFSDIPTVLDDFRYASSLLFKQGYEKEADTAINNCLELFSNSRIPNGKFAAYEVIIYYALETNQPMKAFKVADELLEKKPDHIGALTIKMYEHLGYRRLDKAKEIAQKIIDNPINKDTRNYKAATQILAIDPNQLPSQ